MKFLGLHHILLDSTLGHIPQMLGPSRGGWFVQTVLIEDISLIMTFLDSIMFVLNVMLRHTCYIVGSSGVFLVCTDISC